MFRTQSGFLTVVATGGVVLAGCAAGPRGGEDDPGAELRRALERERSSHAQIVSELRTDLRLARDRAEVARRGAARAQRELEAARQTAASHEESLEGAMDLVRQRAEELVRLREELSEARESAQSGVPVPPEGELAGAMKLLREKQRQIERLRGRLAEAETQAPGGEAGGEEDEQAPGRGGVRLANLDLGQPVALVDGEPIRRRHFVEFLYRDLATPKLLDLFINRFLIFREARRRGIEVTRVDEQVWVEEQLLENIRSAGGEEAFGSFLQERGYTREAWEARLRYQARPALLLRRLVEIHRQTPEGEEAFQERIRAAYDRAYSERVSARHIFFRAPQDAGERVVAAAREAAEAAVRDLERGVPFADVARRRSQDARSRDMGGYLGEVDRSRFSDLPQLNTVLFSLEEGEVSEPVRSELGLHIVRVEDHQPPAKPFDAATRRELIARLEDQPPSEGEKKALMGRLRAAADIKIALGFDDAREGR